MTTTEATTTAENAEDVTLLDHNHVPLAAYEAVAEHVNADEIGALLSLINTINAWNAIGVTTRAWTPGRTSRDIVHRPARAG